MVIIIKIQMSRYMIMDPNAADHT